jgi:uncharacterized protein YabN with tetrapyrrole methylase and pyrophosphatase domain
MPIRLWKKRIHIHFEIPENGELAVSKNLNLAELNLVEMDELWEEAKVSEK